VEGRGEFAARGSEFTGSGEDGDFLGLRAFLALDHFEFHLLAFFQGPIAGRIDRREVYENVFAFGPLDKP
jgi:hypothetical protein